MIQNLTKGNWEVRPSWTEVHSSDLFIERLLWKAVVGGLWGLTNESTPKPFNPVLHCLCEIVPLQRLKTLGPFSRLHSCLHYGQSLRNKMHNRKILKSRSQYPIHYQKINYIILSTLQIRNFQILISTSEVVEKY